MITPLSFFDFSFWQNFVSNGLATLLGVAIGIPIALWINNLLEKQTEVKHKKKILSVLKVELMENDQILTRWVESGKDKLGVIVVNVRLKDELWSTFSDGGELEWIKDTQLLVELARAFSGIRSIKELSGRYLDMDVAQEGESMINTRSFIWGALDGSVRNGVFYIKSVLATIERDL